MPQPIKLIPFYPHMHVVVSIKKSAFEKCSLCGLTVVTAKALNIDRGIRITEHSNTGFPKINFVEVELTTHLGRIPILSAFPMKFIVSSYSYTGITLFYLTVTDIFISKFHMLKLTSSQPLIFVHSLSLSHRLKIQI